MIDVLVTGPTGKMGHEVIHQISQDSRFRLVGCLVRDVKLTDPIYTTHPNSNTRLTLDRYCISSFPSQLKFDAVIDFSSAEYALQVAQFVKSHSGTLVSGTTGLTQQQLEILDHLSHNCRILHSGNLSYGVHVLRLLVEQAAKLLDMDYDVDIIDQHHAQKKDAPSGTSLLLGQAIAEVRNIPFSPDPRDHQPVNGPRSLGTTPIAFSSIRAGSIIGIHEVIFSSNNERITLTHESHSRGLYAKGALNALLWLSQQPYGRYTMREYILNKLKPS